MKDIKPSHIMEFNMICNKLNKLIRKVNRYCPEAEYYLSATSFNLLNGSSHDWDGVAHQERVVASNPIQHCNGGDW
jgi:hypothetical protein